MTRLDRLCKLYDQQGGTIFQFNGLYNTDFLALNEADFNNWYACMLQDKVVFGKLSRYCWIETGVYQGSLNTSHWSVVGYLEPEV